MLEVGTEILNDLSAACSREWLETNGIGGYAMSSLAGMNTRRYHGLLCAATRAPLGRMMLLSKLEEVVHVGDLHYELSTNRYPATISPEGYKYLERFRLDPFPIWTFRLGDVVIEKRIFMVHGENTTVIAWATQGDVPAPVTLAVRPMLAFRDHHHLRHEDAGFDTSFNGGTGCVSFRPFADGPELLLANNAKECRATGYWYRDLEYAIEEERGFDFREDIFQPAELTFDLSDRAIIVASLGARSAEDAAELEEDEVRRRAELIVHSGAESEDLWPLVLAADQFIVRRGTGHTVIAGYPWFSDWGRDTMIALPGLTLAVNRPTIARSILEEFSRHISEGMLPNRFPDEDSGPEYNTADATLWYFEAVRAYLEATGDGAFASAIYEVLADVIDWHIRGTRFGIRLDDDGLLHAGRQGTQLTWMDAMSDGRSVTPRVGKPVEIQALWYNALCTMAELAAERKDAAARSAYRALAERTRTSFRDKFWNRSARCLYDVIGDDGSPDASVRPNQIFAVSLHHTMLVGRRARAVVDTVERELLTPYGLRSLSPKDGEYAGEYIGSPTERDAVYHQGTVWSWLIGPFVEAYRRTHPRTKQTDARVREILAPLMRHLGEAAIGQVSEIFDGDAPHAPRGCAAQAWSVAELLRVLHSPSK